MTFALPSTIFPIPLFPDEEFLSAFSVLLLMPPRFCRHSGVGKRFKIVFIFAHHSSSPPSSNKKLLLFFCFCCWSFLFRNKSFPFRSCTRIAFSSSLLFDNDDDDDDVVDTTENFSNASKVTIEVAFGDEGEREA